MWNAFVLPATPEWALENLAVHRFQIEMILAVLILVHMEPVRQTLCPVMFASAYLDIKVKANSELQTLATQICLSDTRTAETRKFHIYCTCHPPSDARQIVLNYETKPR